MLLKLIEADWVQIKLNNQQFSLLFKSICENGGINISIFQGSMQQAATEEKQCLSDTYRYVVERFKAPLMQTLTLFPQLITRP